MTGEELRRIAIVGGGIASLTAAETLRREGFDGDLTIIGDEPHAPYSRPALSKAALLDDEMTSHRLPDPEHGAQVVRGTPVTRLDLDLDRRTLHLAHGDPIEFDGLVIASGSRARRLSDSPAELTLRGLDDAVALRAALASHPDVIVIGGGPLAMEVASGCRATGSAVTLISRRAPMTSQLGDVLAGALGAAARDAGVRLVRSAHVAVDDCAGGARVTLDDGRVLEAPLVVTAIGDDANVEWLAGSGLLHDGQLRVDSRGRVAPGIVAAGDVATLHGVTGWSRVPLWTSAIEQAKVAAAALLHGDAAPELSFQPYFWTDQFGLSLKVCGALPVAGDPEVIDGSIAEGRALLRWEHEGGSATAAALGYRIPVPRLRAHTRPLVAEA